MGEERPVPGWTGEARDLEGPLWEGPVLPPNAPESSVTPSSKSQQLGGRAWPGPGRETRRPEGVRQVVRSQGALSFPRGAPSHGLTFLERGLWPLTFSNQNKNLIILSL